jgi:hypothetical protein
MNTPNKTFRRTIRLLLCGSILAPVLSNAGILDFLLSKDELQAITVTDMTQAGSFHRPATPEKPVYFVAVSAGFINLGGAKAGEKPVSRELVNKTMLKALAKQGYLPASAGHEPDIVLVWSWGTMNAERSPFMTMSTPLNHRQIMRFLGGEKFGYPSIRNDAFREYDLVPGLMPGGDLDVLLDVAKNDLFIAVINAYDVKRDDLKKPVMLWHTRVSCPSRGYWLSEAMPAMLAIASPFIGRETAKPVWIRATDKFRPDIQLGDTKLVEYIERGNPPVLEIGPSS